MVEIYYIAVAVAVMISLVSWRTGMYLAILFDVVRDPVRKMTEDRSILITVAACAIWGGVFLGLVFSETNLIQLAFKWYSRLRLGIVWLILALIPGAIIATILYVDGYKLAMIGGISYLAPLLGIAIGFAFPKTEVDLKRILGFYVIINSIALVGTVLEWQNFDLPALGGIDMEWIRHHGHLQVKLIAGFYRSPDIMGLHAAHVIVFCAVLAMQSKDIGKLGWSSFGVWAAFCLLLSGRRKMIGIPLVFLVSFVLISFLRGSPGASKIGKVLALVAIIGAVFIFSSRDIQSTSEYQEFASTLFSRGIERSNEVVFGSIFTTLNQSGMLGSGLGSATQGKQYVRTTKDLRAWQEDGASRCFKELGVTGVFCIVISFMYLIKTVMSSIRYIPREHPYQQFQIGLLAIVIGNIASFTISHQQYSGDPVNALMVLFLLGTVLGMPRLFADAAYQQSLTHNRRRNF